MLDPLAELVLPGTADEGTQMLALRQSSLVAPRLIRNSRASTLYTFFEADSYWGQASGYWVASIVLLAFAAATGGKKRKFPVGGFPKGTPRNCVTSGVVPFIRPAMGPDVVLITKDWQAADAAQSKAAL